MAEIFESLGMFLAMGSVSGGVSAAQIGGTAKGMCDGLAAVKQQQQLAQQTWNGMLSQAGRVGYTAEQATQDIQTIQTAMIDGITQHTKAATNVHNKYVATMNVTIMSSAAMAAILIFFLFRRRDLGA